MPPESSTPTPATPSLTLREVTQENLRAVWSLAVADHQQQFVAPVVYSIAEAHFSEHAWYRAIYAGEEPVGFVMLSLDQEHGEYYLWRYLIDAKQQGKGYGRQALQMIIDYVKRLPNATALTLSYVKAEGGPEEFYRRLGFENTGEIDDGEHVMRLDL
jgi:diamine N-acetyltransferase